MHCRSIKDALHHDKWEGHLSAHYRKVCKPALSLDEITHSKLWKFWGNICTFLNVALVTFTLEKTLEHLIFISSPLLAIIRKQV